MGNFNREDKGGFRSGGRNGQRDGGRPNFQKKSWGGNDSGNKEQMMHQATCSECGKRCEVPFRPVNGKPVFCNDCFSAKRGANPVSDRVPAKLHFEKRGGNGSEGNDGVRRQLSDMNMKLDRLIKAIETMTGTGPKTVVIETPKKEEKKSVDSADLKKALDKATEKEHVKAKTAGKEAVKTAPKKVTKKAAVPKKKK